MAALEQGNGESLEEMDMSAWYEAALAKGTAADDVTIVEANDAGAAPPMRSSYQIFLDAHFAVTCVADIISMELSRSSSLRLRWDTGRLPQIHSGEKVQNVSVQLSARCKGNGR